MTVFFFFCSYQDVEGSCAAYISHVESELARFSRKSGRRGLAAILLEPFFGVSGVFIPPKAYMQSLFRCARQNGAIVIADEVTTGLGRSGEHLWSFQNYGVVPDIVVVSLGIKKKKNASLNF